MTFIHQNIARRQFLRRSAAIAAVAGSPLAANLAAIGNAAAQTATDYKAMVCVFLFGGNDQGNTIVPISTADYNAYKAYRLSLSLTQSGVLPISPVATDIGNYIGPQLGLHPALTGIKTLFDQGKCAILPNVATLVEPTTLARYNSGAAKLPSQLFSHSDQASAWQTGMPDAPSETGWLGRIADLTNSQNTGQVSMCMSIAGNNSIQVGANVIQYQLTTDGSVKIDSLDPNNGFAGYSANSAILRSVLTEQRTHLLENQYSTIAKRSIVADTAVRAAIGNIAPFQTQFADDDLSAQLKMVARMIASRNSLQHKRQIFFVSMGGFDFHDDLPFQQNERLAKVSAAITAFYNTTVELGVANSVTTFTASDFGRAMLSNGFGSDHGWGGHHFVVGGAVKGGRVYGKFPNVAKNSPDDVGEGRLLPSTSVDEYAAVLARWFGVTNATDLATVLPNLSRFANYNMAFL